MTQRNAAVVDGAPIEATNKATPPRFAPGELTSIVSPEGGGVARRIEQSIAPSVQPLAVHLNNAVAGSAMPALTSALKHHAATQLRSDLKVIAADRAEVAAIAVRSYRHANGFTKLVLTDSVIGRLRLHVWEPGAVAEENIHEHRWHFASAVLAGTMESEIWVDSFDRDAPTFPEFIYHVRDRGATRRPVGRTRVTCSRSVIRQAGEAYFMPPGVLHRITGTSGLTATLVFTTAPSRAWNRMLARDGVQPDVRRRPLRSADVVRLIDMLLPQLSGKEDHVHRH